MASSISRTLAQTFSSRQRRIILGLALLGLVTLFVVPLPLPAATGQDRYVTVNARSFAFTPGTVQVAYGDRVHVTLEAADVVHGLYLDGYGISVEAEPGRPAQLSFVADRNGTFRFRCSVSCGDLHPFMIGKLVVGPNLLWLRAVAAALLTMFAVLAFFWRP